MARTLAILLLLAFLTAGCADDDEDGDADTDTTTTTSGGTTVSASGSITFTGTGSQSNGTVHKTVVDDDFPNGDFTIKRGDAVNWTATGTAHPHSVTSDIGLFDSSPSCTAGTTAGCMQSGQSYEFEFDLAPGTYTYKCKVHPTTMTGTITVTS